MAITDYGSLKTAAQVWAARSDSVLTGQFDTFLQFAEDRIYNGGADPRDALFSQPLRSRIMETADTVTLTDGVGTLPDDCLSLIKIFPTGGLIGTTSVPPERFAELSANILSGDTIYHTIEAGELKMLPSLTGSAAITYYKRHPAITSVVTTGPTIQQHGVVYLSAVLFELFTFLQEGELAGAHLSRLKSQIAGENRTADALRHAGPLRVRPRVVIGG